jgi:hypothetical protein
MPAKITVRLKEGTTFSREVQDYPGMPSHPFSWADTVGKFDQLVAGRVDTDLANQIEDAVRSVENIQVKDLMTLLHAFRSADAVLVSHISGPARPRGESAQSLVPLEACDVVHQARALVCQAGERWRHLGHRPRHLD